VCQKEQKLENEYKRISNDPNVNSNFGFLHIPKTTGAGLKDFFEKTAEAGFCHPVKFSHHWSVSDIVRYFPDMKISFVLRDPVQRMVSGFNSRLRMGRPRNNNVWSCGEAISFSMFQDPTSLLLGLISDDEFEKSAAIFSTKNISHLLWNYEYYFGSTEIIAKQEAHLGTIGDFERYDEFFSALCSDANLPENLIDELYEKSHVAPQESEKFIERIDETNLLKVREYFSQEYRIYNYLKELEN